MPVIPTLGRLRQNDQEFQSSLGYTARPCLKKIPKTVNKNEPPIPHHFPAGTEVPEIHDQPEFPWVGLFALVSGLLSAESAGIRV
jgi:hypothetical protein